MAEWHRWCEGKLVSPEEAVSEIKPGEKVVFGAYRYPGSLWAIMEALARRKGELRGVKVVGMTGLPPGPWFNPGFEESFEILETISLRLSREARLEGRVQHVPDPFGLRHPDRLLEPGRASVILGADWVVIPVTVPSKGGYLTFGSNAWSNLSCARTAKKVIGVAHPQYPWTYGETIHISELTCLVESVPSPPEYTFIPPPVPEDEESAIDLICALASDLIRDGDTIQIGTGTASMALPSFLTHKNDLGVHTEMLLPEMVLDLVRAGVANGSRKNVNRGKCIGSHIVLLPGDPRLQECLDFVDHNPQFEFRDLSYICHIPVIASHDNLITVNTALAIDLRGQLIVDHVGFTAFAGLGGALDFAIGSHYSRGGRAITLLLSTALEGKASRIVSQFPAGAPVSLPGVYVDYLVTEQGVVNLEGRTPRQRAEAIISVAHPDFQPELRKSARKMFWP